jgi:hypothetical protein
MVIQREQRADDVQPSQWAPLRSRVYRSLFIAQRWRLTCRRGRRAPTVVHRSLSPGYQ